MNSLPRHQALLGVDVIGSARNPGHYLAAVKTATDTMLRTALADEAIPSSRVTNWEPTGDGAMVTLPSSDLGVLLDAMSRLETLAAQHNQWNKPEVRLRIAVHVGPVGPEPGFYEPKITLSRLLNAPVFKQVMNRCLAEAATVNTGLIVSDDAYRAVFGGDHTRLVEQADFASVAVSDKEFSQPAWIRVPRFEPRSITTFATTEPDSAPTPVRKPSHARPSQAQNITVHGDAQSIQAAEISGNISFKAGTP